MRTPEMNSDLTHIGAEVGESPAMQRCRFSSAARHCIYIIVNLYKLLSAGQRRHEGMGRGNLLRDQFQFGATGLAAFEHSLDGGASSDHARGGCMLSRSNEFFGIQCQQPQAGV